MKDSLTFAERLAPDTVNRLERAARHRYESANVLWKEKRRLAALYMFGYTAEICLATAYYRCAGFAPNAEIDRETRNRRMAQARLIEMPNGDRLMPARDAHPILGWARFLEYERIRVGNPSAQDRQRLREAVAKAALVYSYWRPSLRYKVVDFGDEALQKVQKAAKWLLDNHPQL
jgi:hypothetical protein